MILSVLNDFFRTNILMEYSPEGQQRDDDETFTCH